MSSTVLKLVYATITLSDSLGFGIAFRANVLTSEWKIHSHLFFSQLLLFLHTFVICMSAHMQTAWCLTGVWIRYRKYFSLLTVYSARWNESLIAPLNFNSTVAVMTNLVVWLWAIVLIPTHREIPLLAEETIFFKNNELCIQQTEQLRALLQCQDHISICCRCTLTALTPPASWNYLHRLPVNLGDAGHGSWGAFTH